MIGESRAHIQDSLAPAEHLDPRDIQAQIEGLGNKTNPGSRIQRAGLLFEHALATPDTEGDIELIQQAKAELNSVIQLGLPVWDKRNITARVLHSYTEGFLKRALGQNNGVRTRRDVKRGLGNLMMDLLEDDPEPTSTVTGRMSELVAKTYLLESGLFPYPGLHREEANLYTEDNHDLYVLSSVAGGVVLKSPVSVKFRDDRTQTHENVLTLRVGRLTLETARDSKRYHRSYPGRTTNGSACWQSLRLATDLMICQTSGEPVDRGDASFMGALAGKLRMPVIRHMANIMQPDYRHNALLLNSLGGSSK